MYIIILRRREKEIEKKKKLCCRKKPDDRSTGRGGASSPQLRYYYYYYYLIGRYLYMQDEPRSAREQVVVQPPAGEGGMIFYRVSAAAREREREREREIVLCGYRARWWRGISNVHLYRGQKYT